MKIKTKKIKLYTEKFNYSCEVGGLKVFVYKGDTEIFARKIQLNTKPINTFEDLEEIAGFFEMQVEMIPKVNNLIKKGKKKDQAISIIVSEYETLTTQ